ncbi:hypothetical protein AAC387_Pa02g4748 [Persea americana]
MSLLLRKQKTVVSIVSLDRIQEKSIETKICSFPALFVAFSFVDREKTKSLPTLHLHPLFGNQLKDETQ